MVQAYRSDAIVTPDRVTAGALLVEGERIVGVCGTGEIPLSAQLVDFGPMAILPGLVDSHVHINEPGRGDWEGFATATRAAAAGGYTTLVDMPLNGLPETTSVAAFQAKRAAAEGVCSVDWAAWGGCVRDSYTPQGQERMQSLTEAGVCGFKCFLIYPGCEGFTMVNRAELVGALPAIVRTGLPLLVHAELEGPIAAAAEGLKGADWTKYSTYLAGRPDEAELEAVRMLLELCREYKFRLHIVHLATALALAELKAARAEGLPVTVETCPHYLYFAAEEIPDGSTLHKCAPPVRGRENREALWEGLRDGTIDLVATDHSPCPPAMKRLEEGRFDLAWGGIASLSVALPVMWTRAKQRGFSLVDLARWMGSEPAKLAGLDDRAGVLAVGRHATFVVFDPEAEWTIEPSNLHFRHKVSPYVGERVKGRVVKTFLRGAEIGTEPQGRFLTRTGQKEHEEHQENRGSQRRPGYAGGMMGEVLTRWNAESAEQAEAEILACNGSRGWARGVSAGRPYANADAVLAESDRVWAGLVEFDWCEAFATHPRIGERHAPSASATSLAWSGKEQAAAESSSDADTERLAAANLEYEKRFGVVFLICASGLTKGEILAALEQRMGRSAEEELNEAVEQQRRITRLRLGRWLRGE